MFKADLNLSKVSLTGLAALDERRRLKLADAAELRTPPKGVPYIRRDVSEGFARTHANVYAQQNHANFYVPLSSLTPEDVTLDAGGCLNLNELMSEARFFELCQASGPAKAD